jgi:hypothetical protein
MFKQGKKILLGVGVVAALGLGGSALAAAGTTPVAPTVQHSSTLDHDQIQSGDQSAPDTGSEAPGTETADGDGDAVKGGNDSETQDGSGESAGSEVPNDDGPNGHADEAGGAGAAADHQFDGQE